MPRVTICEIYVDKLPVRLFKVEEGALGGLTIIPYSLHNISYAPKGTIPSASNPKLVQHRISVHVSLDSVENINTIKRTGYLEGGRRLRQMTFTRALKTENLFVPLWAAGCSYPRPHQSSKKRKGHYVCLGSYHPDAFRLIYCVLVAKAGSKFEQDSETALLDSFEYGLFKIVILWTFLRVSSTSFGIWISVGSEQIEEYDGQDPKRKSEQGFTPGFTADQSIELFDSIKTQLRDVLFTRSGPVLLTPSDPEFAYFTKHALLNENERELARNLTVALSRMPRARRPRGR
jgi:hypothetical protein